MKVCTLLIFVALLVSISSPYTAHLSTVPTDQTTHFVALDVCHANGSYISTNADGAYLHEPPRQLLPLSFARFIDIADHHFHPNVLLFRLERPPRT
jgi:hypothetical protein